MARPSGYYEAKALGFSSKTAQLLQSEKSRGLRSEAKSLIQEGVDIELVEMLYNEEKFLKATKTKRTKFFYELGKMKNFYGDGQKITKSQAKTIAEVTEAEMLERIEKEKKKAKVLGKPYKQKVGRTFEGFEGFDKGMTEERINYGDKKKDLEFYEEWKKRLRTGGAVTADERKIMDEIIDEINRIGALEGKVWAGKITFNHGFGYQALDIYYKNRYVNAHEDKKLYKEYIIGKKEIDVEHLAKDRVSLMMFSNPKSYMVIT